MFTYTPQTPTLIQLERLLSHDWKNDPEIARQIHQLRHEALAEVNPNTQYMPHLRLTYPKAIIYLINLDQQREVQAAFDEEHFEVYYR